MIVVFLSVTSWSTHLTLTFLWHAVRHVEYRFGYSLFQTSFGHKVRAETMANWRDCIKNRTALLSLLVSAALCLDSSVDWNGYKKHIPCHSDPILISNLCYDFSLRTSETNYLNESFAFYSAIRMRGYYSKANKEERWLKFRALHFCWKFCEWSQSSWSVISHCSPFPLGLSLSADLICCRSVQNSALSLFIAFNSCFFFSISDQISWSRSCVTTRASLLSVFCSRKWN